MACVDGCGANGSARTARQARAPGPTYAGGGARRARRAHIEANVATVGGGISLLIAFRDRGPRLVWTATLATSTRGILRVTTTDRVGEAVASSRGEALAECARAARLISPRIGTLGVAARDMGPGQAGRGRFQQHVRQGAVTSRPHLGRPVGAAVRCASDVLQEVPGDSCAHQSMSAGRRARCRPRRGGWTRPQGERDEHELRTSREGIAGAQRPDPGPSRCISAQVGRSEARPTPAC